MIFFFMMTYFSDGINIAYSMHKNILNTYKKAVTNVLVFLSNAMKFEICTIPLISTDSQQQKKQQSREKVACRPLRERARL